MQIVSWNIQSARGVDGRADLDRIVARIRSYGEPELICLQEVTRFIPELDGGAGADQVAGLGHAFADYEAIFGPGIDRAGTAHDRRRQYGNMILSRRPIEQAFLHRLPGPPDPGVKQMPRQAIEIVVAASCGRLRIVTTHLDYHSAVRRAGQVEALRALHREVAANLRQPPAWDGSPLDLEPRPETVVMCGDFNLLPDGPEYARLLAPFGDGTAALCDAWAARNGGRAHDPTCGLFDRRQWESGPHCRDYFFVSADLAPRVREVAVDLETDASDHQPIRLWLAG